MRYFLKVEKGRVYIRCPLCHNVMYLGKAWNEAELKKLLSDAIYMAMRCSLCGARLTDELEVVLEELNRYTTAA